MQAKASLSSFIFSQPTPELPVRDVARAQAHLRDKLGFQVGRRPNRGALTQFTVEDLDGNRFYFHRD